MREDPLKWRRFSFQASCLAAGMFFFGCFSEFLISDELLRVIIALLGIVLLIVLRLISIFLWKCPKCGRKLPRRGMMEAMENEIRCPRCHALFCEEE